ncbi:MAG: hypothetical protein L0099_16520, partial [Acidobacteria bacterium]|nr:hypothetical protein [Acidobacteriota bacterium]
VSIVSLNNTLRSLGLPLVKKADLASPTSTTRAAKRRISTQAVKQVLEIVRGGFADTCVVATYSLASTVREWGQW